MSFFSGGVLHIDLAAVTLQDKVSALGTTFLRRSTDKIGCRLQRLIVLFLRGVKD